MRIKYQGALAASAIALLLAACGGGSSTGAAANAGGTDSPGSTSGQSLSGTAAVGAPLAAAVVVLKDSRGNTLTTTADAGGVFTFADVSQVVAPFMLQASGTAAGVNQVLYSLATDKPGVLNVTPATDVITAQALGEDPASAFQVAATISAADPAQLTAARSRLSLALENVFSALQIEGGDLMNTRFAADSTGLDKLLDLIGFQAQVVAGEQVVVVTNRVSGVGVAIEPDSTTPDKLPAASSELALDVGGINTLISNFNTLMATEASIRSPEMLDLYTASYLSEGRDRNAEIEELAQFAGSQFIGMVLNGCDTGQPVVCRVQVGYRDADGSEGSDPVVVQRGPDGKWRFYGDQADFEYDLTPVASSRFNVVGGASTRQGLQGGANLNVSRDIGGSANPSPSATLELSLDNGSTWNAVPMVRFIASSTCPYLEVSTAPGSCGNFFVIPDNVANQANAAMLQGALKSRVTVYPSSSSTTSLYTHVAKVTTRLFTQATADAALSRSGIAVTGVQDAGTSVSFAGVGLEYLRVDTEAASGFSTLRGQAEWQGGVNLLGGNVTVDKVRARCIAQGEFTSVCNSTIPSNARISSLMLVSRNPQNQFVWAFHAFPLQ